MKQKYILNDNLVFVKVERSIKDRLKRFYRLFLLGLGFSLFLWGLTALGFINSPFHKLHAKRNHKLVQKVTQINTKFDSISNALKVIQHRDNEVYRVISQIEPIPASVRKAGFGGSKSYSDLDGYENSDLLIESNLKSDILQKQLMLQTQSYDKVTNCVELLTDSLLSIPAVMPISPRGYYRISSYFGYRIHPITKRREKHDGIDFASKPGRPIYASGNGVVSRIVYSKSGYGNMIMIDHGYGYETRFAHLDEILVSKGDKVVRGAQIGTIGNTGRSTGPHLHYEVIFNKKRMNPTDYYINDLTIDQYDEMVEAFTRN